MRSIFSHLPRPRASPTTTTLTVRPRRRPLTSTSTTTPTTPPASPSIKPPSTTSPSPSPPSSSSFSPWATYSRLLRDHPIKTKLVTSSFLMGTGDISCQALTRYQKQLEHQEAHPSSSLPPFLPPYNWHRTAKFFFLGGVVVGPALHHWYSFLIRFSPAQTTAGALKRLALDQLVFAPTFIPLFWSGLQFLDLNFDLNQLRGKLERDYKDTLIANWVVWVPAMLVNFRFVPTHCQVLFSNAIGFGWNIFLSSVSHK